MKPDLEAVPFDEPDAPPAAKVEGNGAPPLRLLANELITAGMCIVPATARKLPALDGWKDYQRQLPHADEVDEWFANVHAKPYGIGFVCGAVSGGLEVLDLDAKHDPTKSLNARAEAAIREIVPGLWERLVIESTPSGGLHLYFRSPNPAGNLKLAYGLNAEGKRMAVAETRGEGGFIVAAPTPGYVLLQGRLSAPPLITDDERSALFAAARSLETAPAPATPAQAHAGVAAPFDRSTLPAGFILPGEAYNALDEWKPLIEKQGWTLHHEPYWTRPGKKRSEGISASFGVAGPHTFHVFTPNAPPLEDGENYTPFALYAIFECGGDYKRAADELYARNHGTRRKPKPELHTAGENGHAPEASDRKSGETPVDQPKPPAIPARSIDSFAVPADDDPTVLLGNRYLCRGDGLVLSSASGMGKSALVIQAAVHWALGRPFMGIKPNGCLRSLIIQSEDSDGDIGEVWASVLHEMKMTEAERKSVSERVVIVTDRVNRGLTFMTELRRHVMAATYDLVWINPLAAFITGDATTQEATAKFLREGLNGINTLPRFAYLIVQHTTKPASGKDKPTRQWHEIQYDMAGSYDLIGWARAIMSLRPTAIMGEFNLVLAKRGRRAGVTKEVPQGTGFRLENTITIPMMHSTGKFKVDHIKRELDVIYWIPRDDTPAESPPERSVGRPKKNNVADFLAIFPTGIKNAMGVNELHREALKIRLIGKGSIYTIINEAMDAKIIVCDSSNPKSPCYYVRPPVSDQELI